MLNGKLSALRWVLGSEWDFPRHVEAVSHTHCDGAAVNAVFGQSGLAAQFKEMTPASSCCIPRNPRIERGELVALAPFGYQL
jgi:hypothetical protein